MIEIIEGAEADNNAYKRYKHLRTKHNAPIQGKQYVYKQYNRVAKAKECQHPKIGRAVFAR